MTITDIVDPGFYFFDGTTAILPKEEVEKGNFANNPVGLGPFKFKEHIPGSRVVLERFDKFFKPGKPYADRLVVVLMSEAAARDVAFRNKEIDTSILGPAQYVAYRADPALSKGILEVAEMFTRSMRMNPSFKPFSDKRVRQAINYAIDTDLIVKRLVKDKAYRATSWLPLSSPSFDKAVKPYAYDPDKAKKLLAEAGYPDGFEFEWTTSQNESWGLPIVEAVIPMLAKVGIKAKPKLVEVTVQTDIIIKGDFQAVISSSLTGPELAGAAQVLPLDDAAHGLQHLRLQQSDPRQAGRRGRPDDRRRQADRAPPAGQQPDLRGSPRVVLQLQQGGARLPAVDSRPAGQSDRDHASVCRGYLGRRQVAGEVTASCP